MEYPKRPASESLTYQTRLKHLTRNPNLADLYKWYLHNPELALERARQAKKRHQKKHKAPYKAYQHQYYLLHREELLPKHRESARRSKERRKTPT